MVLERRQFLFQSSLLGAGLILPSFGLFAQTNKSLLFSACRQKSGLYGLVMADLLNYESHIWPVDHRCHSLALSKKHNTVSFVDRRPGEFIYVYDFNSLDRVQVISRPEGFRFYGHAVLNVDESLLFVTANNLSTLEGRILVYDIETNYSLVDNISSGGIGPHEIVRHPDKDIFYICNGGLKTHPDSGREILNFETMAPNLTLFDNEKREVKSFELENSKLSIRHIEVNHHGDAFIGVQDKDFFPGEGQAMVAFYDFDKDSLYQDSDSSELHLLSEGYVASVSMDGDSKLGLATCPKSDLVGVWDLEALSLKETIDCKEASGVCYSKDLGAFVITNGSGEVYSYKEGSLKFLFQAPFQWDNHAEVL